MTRHVLCIYRYVDNILTYLCDANGVVNGTIAFLGWRWSKWCITWLFGHVITLAPHLASWTAYSDAFLRSRQQIVIPYTKGTAESIKHICGKYGIQVHFKGNTTIKQILMKPKDPDPKDNRSGLIYSYRCLQLDCNDEYIGETGRTLGERRKEQLKQPWPIHRHSQTTGHPIEDQNFNIIGREDWGQARTIKESIYIRLRLGSS